MSQLNDDRVAQGSRKKKQAAVSKRGSGLFAFHPTKEQRERLKSWSVDISKNLEMISTFVEDNCLFSVGFKAENASFYVMLKDRREAWEIAACVSVWHTDLAKAMGGMSFYLSEVNPEFPAKVPTNDQWVDEW